MLLLPKRTMMIGGALLGVVYMYGMGGENPFGAAPTSGEAKCRMSVTADVLNVRAAPDKGAGIVGKFKQGAETDADTAVQNGYRKLAEGKWAATEFLKPLPGRTC